MMLSYKSDYPNQVHQLNISISQNYYLLSNDEIKYQNKKFDINWINYIKTGKKHLVNFLIRDHYSNCFYAEIHPIERMPHLKDFLFNAWKNKENFEFCGIPNVLIVGKNLIQDHPEIITFYKRFESMSIQLAQNGFATGIRSIRDWENSIKYFTFFEKFKNITEFQRHTEYFCREINLRKSGKAESNLKKWTDNNPKGIVINDITEFYKYYEE